MNRNSGAFMKACIVLSALWIFAAAVTVVYFHAVGRPLPEMVAAFLFAPGIGELGFSALVKSAKEKAGAGAADTENAAEDEDTQKNAESTTAAALRILDLVLGALIEKPKGGG